MKENTVLKVPLSIEERTGAARRNALVSNGIPLPLGRIFDASELAVKDESGEVVKAGFSPLQKWQDGSWRFVLVTFLTHLQAYEVKGLMLEAGGFRPVGSGLRVNENDDMYVVNTGKVKLEINKKSFNVINRLWLQEEQMEKTGLPVIDTHTGGVKALVDGICYTSSAGSVFDSTIERQDETHIVIRTEGKLGNGCEERLDYKVWVKAYAGSSEIDVQFNIAKKEGDIWEHCFEIGEISLELPLVKSSTLQYLFGGRDSTYRGTLAGSTGLYQKSSDSYDFINNSVVKETVKSGKSDKCLNTGWAALNNGETGMGAAYRWFWQNNPSAMELSEDGNLSVQVWPGRHEPFKLYTGVAKTTDIRLYFYNSSESVIEVGDRLRAHQLITFAKCPTSWYCQETKAIDPRLLDMDRNNWPQSEHGMLDLYNAIFDEAYRKMLCGRDENPHYAPGEDGYGFMNFGDGWESGGGYITPKHSGITWWSNNYYDHPYVFMLHFFRTGELKYLDYALECEYHLMDIDTASYDPVNHIPGEYKTCPSVAHIKFYLSPVKDEAGEVIDFEFGGQGGHWHFQGVEGLFQAYYLTGCSQSVERGLESAEFAMQKHTMNLDSQTRTIGHTLEGLAAAYRHTLEQRYLERMNWVWEQARELALKERFDPKVENPYRVEYKPYIYVRGNWPFQTGIVLGGIYKYRCWSPFVNGELGIDNISRNTMAYEIKGRVLENGFNGGWREKESRWNYAADIMTASASWLHSIFPEENFLDVFRKAAVNNLEASFADRCKTFSQSFKYQWQTQYELAKEEVQKELYVSFSAYPLSVKNGGKVTFNNQSLGMQKCLWSFGDGSISNSTDVNVVHRYDRPGVYTVSLKAEGTGGQKGAFEIKGCIIVGMDR